jgi:hypothetical protein
VPRARCHAAGKVEREPESPSAPRRLEQHRRHSADIPTLISPMFIAFLSYLSSQCHSLHGAPISSLVAVS